MIVDSAGELGPDASPGTAATLRLGGGDPAKPSKGAAAATEFDVVVAHRKQGTEVTVTLQVQGETLEQEVYESSPEAFRLVTATDDSFAPSIDLLRFPAREGASWEWDGKVVYAGVSRPASATVTLSKHGEELLSAVHLKISADPGRPELQRDLKFWFTKGKGVVRRSFGEVSSRRPAGDAWPL
ncbi:hypothetical protein EON82_00030 [bacterium]|nr:MAG: hypothetical protein EON82_00030 [bacterium]